MSTVQYTKSLSVVAEPVVLVCGTGLAPGIGAAAAAARNGVSTMEGLPFAPLAKRKK